MKYFFALATIVSLSCTSLSHAAPADFMPKFFWFGADLEVEGGYTREGNERDGNKKIEEQKGLQEKLILQTVGYVYHPSLFYFEAEMSADFDDESRRKTASLGSSEWRGEKTVDEEYDFDGKLFARKPLNLELHLSQERPFLTSGYASSGETVGRFNSQITLNYKKKYFVSSLLYSYNSTDRENNNTSKAQIFRTVTNTISSHLGYRVENYSVGSAIYHSETKTEGETSISAAQLGRDTVDQLNLFGTIRYKNFIFDSNAIVEETVQSEKEGFGVNLRENIDIDLPWNMNSRIKLFHDRNEETDFGALADIGADKVNETNSFRGVLNHQLFDSIFSTIRAVYQKNDTTTSRRVDQDYRLSARYTKSLRHGNVNAIVENGLIQTEQQGVPRIDAERQDEDITLVNNSFRINRSNAVPDSLGIEVFNTNCTKLDIQCPDFVDVDPVTLKSGAWQIVPEDQWSIVDPNAQYLQVIFDGGGIPLIVTDFTPDLQGPSYKNLIRVSYLQPEADFIVQSNSSSISAEINLFDELFAAYFEHILTSQEYIEGDRVFGEISPIVTEDEVGITLTKAPFDVITSYRVLRSEFHNEDRWRLNSGYRQMVNFAYKITANWGAQYVYEGLLEEDSLGAEQSSSESKFVARVGLFSKIPYTPLTVSPTSTYTRKRGGVNEHELNTEGIWETSDLVDVNDSDIFSNGIKFGITFPYINIKASLYGRYKLEDNFTDDNQIITTDLGFQTSRSKQWVFGGTTITLNGLYNIDSSRVKTTRGSGVVTETTDVDDEFEIKFNVRRVFF